MHACRQCRAATFSRGLCAGYSEGNPGKCIPARLQSGSLRTESDVMNTHDVLAFAVAAEAVRRIRTADTQWAHLFSPEVYPTSSRNWPMPDFVIVDDRNNTTIAAEFKPPNQTRREYLTGLGQAIAYTKDFTYSLLVVPEVSDDDYAIATHISDVLTQEVAHTVPVGILQYDPRRISPSNRLIRCSKTARSTDRRVCGTSSA